MQREAFVTLTQISSWYTFAIFCRSLQHGNSASPVTAQGISLVPRRVVLLCWARFCREPRTAISIDVLCG